MQVLKSRQKSQLLSTLQLLEKRTHLSDEDGQYLYSMEKGLEGEELFDTQVKKYLKGAVVVLNDLLLTIKGTTIQLDSLMITERGVMVYEIKNYKGGYDLQSGKLLKINGQEILNPLSQLNRSLVKLRQLLNDWNIDEKVEGAVMFVEPSFHLYNADPSDPFIFPTQIQDHFSSANDKMNRLSKTHHLLADKFLTLNQMEAPYQKQLPVFDYPSLKKGLACHSCGGFNLERTQRSCLCKDCALKVSLEATLLKNIEDLLTLFPDEKLTTALIYDWCGGALNFRRIRRTLKNNYTAMGKTTGTYYVQSDKR